MRVRGGVLHLEWHGAFNGRDYAVQGVEVVLTDAYRRLDGHTLELVRKVDGVVAATARLELSPDERTLTITASDDRGTSTTVYRKE